jgi:hypothetical protein
MHMKSAWYGCTVAAWRCLQPALHTRRANWRGGERQSKKDGSILSLFLCISCCLATDNPCVLYSTEATALATTLPHHRRPELRSSGLLRDESPASRTRIVKHQPDMASSSRPGADNDRDESPATRRLHRLCLHLLHLPTASN